MTALKCVPGKVFCDPPSPQNCTHGLPIGQGVLHLIHADLILLSAWSRRKAGAIGSVPFIPQPQTQSTMTRPQGGFFYI
jgi:hypothetical protein